MNRRGGRRAVCAPGICLGAGPEFCVTFSHPFFLRRGGGGGVGARLGAEAASACVARRPRHTPPSTRMRAAPPRRAPARLPPSRRAASRPNAAARAAPRGVVILPGLGNASGDYAQLAIDLMECGVAGVETAPVARLDWARNAAGVVKADYWRGTLAPRPTVDWYLERIGEGAGEGWWSAGASGERRAASTPPPPADRALDLVAATTNGAPVTLLAHSAGGWLARVWLHGGGAERGGVASLVTLGSPHNPPPPDSTSPDQTRGILTWCEANCPGRHHASVAYTTVASRKVVGAALGDDAPLARKLAGVGYAAVCGDARAAGDGIVPVEAAHLVDARGGAIKNITLDDAFHSPLGASPDRPWYGSPACIGAWVGAVAGE